MGIKPKIIAVVGPTASGKTSLGIEIAKLFNGEVVSVDSRQVYKGMDLGTAKFSDDCGVVHWGIDLVDPDLDYSVSDFKQYAEKKIEEIIGRGKLPVLVGGTGFWLQALIDNFDLASTGSDIKLRQQLEGLSVEELFYQYKSIDPLGAENIASDNKRKLVRAIEVTNRTGVPFSKQQTKGESKYNVLQIGLKAERDVLYERINKRVEDMIAKGLVSEVEELKSIYGCKIESMTGIGYRQVCDYLEGTSTLEDSVSEIKQSTRKYAKRQITWFKRDDRIVWIDKKNKAIELIERFIN